MKKDKSRYLLMLAAWLLAAGIIITVLAIMHITPFGNNNLLISDMGAQYNSFLSAWRRMLLTHHVTLYTFAQGLGTNFVPTIAYYLLSPFNVLLLFGQASAVPTIITWILILKVATIALTMTYFLCRHFQTTNKIVLLFAVAYSCCGFVTTSYFNIMWLDALIWLPLIIDGVDEVFNRGRISRLFIWLLISIITNFYLGYMTCLFVGMYTFYQLCEHGQARWRLLTLWRHFGKAVLKVMETGILAAAASAIVLLPTALGMLQTAKTTKTPLSLLPEYGLDVFNQLGVGATNYQSHLTHAPALFCTSLVILLVIFLWVNPQITRWHKRHVFVFLFVLLLTTNLQVFNTIWHLGQQPAGFPFRNVFVIIFMLIVWGWESWQAGVAHVALRWRYLLPAALIILMLLGYYSSRLPLHAISWLSDYNTNVVPSFSLMTSISYIVLTTLLLFIKRQQWLFLIVTSEMLVNWLLVMRFTPLGNQSVYAHAYQQQATQLNKRHKTPYFSRLNSNNTLLRSAYRETYNNYNEGLLFAYDGLFGYNSTLNENSRIAEHNLGLFSRNQRRICGEGLDPISELVLDVQQQLTLSSHHLTSHINHNACGLGVVIPANVANLTLHTTNMLTNQQRLLQNWQGSNLFTPVKIINDQVTPLRNGYRHHLVLQPLTTGPVYLNATHNATTYDDLLVNGHSQQPAINADGFRFLCNLGTHQVGQNFTVTITLQKATVRGLDIASLDQEQWQQCRQRIQQAGTYQPRLTWQHGEPVFTATMINHSTHHWLLLSLPYEPGWHAQINGKSVTPKKILSGLTAVPITTGKNQIKVYYQVPGLRLGILISISALLLYGLIIIKQKAEA